MSQENDANTLSLDELVVQYKKMLVVMGSQLDELQEDLNEKETLCLSMLQLSLEPMFWCDTKFTLEGCNDAFLEFCKKSRATVLQKSLTEILPENIVHEVEKAVATKNASALVEYSVDMIEYTVIVSTIPMYKNGEERGFLVQIVNITDMRKKDEQILYSATHDDLTGLYNRFEAKRYMQNLLDAKEEFYCILLDVMRFSDVNKLDLCVGDCVLTILAERLQSAFEGHFVARIGSDEFMIIVREKNEHVVTDLIQAAHSILAPPITVERHHYTPLFRCSVTKAPRDANTPELLLQNLLLSMDIIKQSALDEIVFYTDSVGEAYKEQNRREKTLRKAIKEHRIVNAYQARVNTQTGVVYGFEALARIQNEDGTTCMPSLFIPEAEKKGLICDVGELVLLNTCNFLKKLAVINRELVVSVNISPQQFSKKLLKDIDTLLAVHNIRAECLELEITESVMVRDIQKARYLLDSFDERGIKIALDDFGKGYSSLYYIKDLPITTLKIDKDFVQDSIHNKRSAAIVQAIATLGRELGMEVVAEGIEEKEAYEHILQYPCTQIQGNYICEPCFEEYSYQWLESYTGVVP